METIRVSGTQTVMSALTEGAVIKLWLDKKLSERWEQMSATLPAPLPANAVAFVSGEQLSQLIKNGGKEGVKQGMVADIRLPQRSLAEVCEGCRPLVVLDGVTDPRNVGAIMRTARAFSVGAVIVPKRRSAAISDVVARTSCGAVVTLPIVQVSNIARTLATIKESQRWVVGACESANNNMLTARLPTNLCWVLGDEGNGLRRLTKEYCDELLRIPTVSGAAGCLNVSTVFAICMAATSNAR